MLSPAYSQGTLQNELGVEMTPWDRFCTEEYELLMAEDQGNAEDVETEM